MDLWLWVWIVIAAVIALGLIVNAANGCDHRWQLRSIVHSWQPTFGSQEPVTLANVLCERCGEVQQRTEAEGHQSIDTIKLKFQIQKRPEGEA